MPNLLPDWLPWIQPAGRLIWSSVLLLVGISFVVALMKPPKLARPFPDRVAYALYPVIVVVGYVVAVVIPADWNIAGWEVDAIIVDLVLIALVAHTHLLIASRTPAPAGKQASWAATYAGAVAVFALLALAYGVVPHEWMTFANGYLRWGDTSKFVWQSSQDMLFFPWHWPFNLDYPAVRDIIVSGIYGVLLGANIALFAQWQKRNQVVEAPPADATPTKRSRFGRPLRRAATGGA